MPFVRSALIQERQERRVLSALVRQAHDAELRARVDAALDRQLAAFLAMQQPLPAAA